MFTKEVVIKKNWWMGGNIDWWLQRQVITKSGGYKDSWLQRPLVRKK